MPYSEGKSKLLPQLKYTTAEINSGFQTMSISEVFGEFRCGKTQLSHTMSVVAQLPKDMGGAEGKVAYIGQWFLNSRRYPANFTTKTQKAHLGPKGLCRLQSASALTQKLVSLVFTRLV